MKEKGDPCILVGCSTQSKGYPVYNKRTRLIVKSIHLQFDEIKVMSETSVANDTSGLVPQRQKASDYDNSDPILQIQHVLPLADTTVPSQQELDLLFGPLYDEFFNAGTSSVNKSSSPIDNSKQRDTPPTTNIPSSIEPTNLTNANVKEKYDNQAEHEFINPFCTSVHEVAKSSSHDIGNSNVHTFTQLQVFEYRWTKITRSNKFVEVHQSQCKQDDNLQQILKCVVRTHRELQVWELVDKPYGKHVIKLKWLRKNKKDKEQTVIGTTRSKGLNSGRGTLDPPIPMRYLYQSGQDSRFELTSFSDTDHAGCIDTRKSTYGGIQFLGDKLVSWMSKKQDCTAMSSVEAEYVALSASCAQVMWMRTQLKDYGFSYNKIPLYCDSQSAIEISCNPVHHTRYHFIKEHVENGIIELYFVRTKYQLADMFTKALLEDRFKYLAR
uniref:Gag-Pol polyprotein n=1 Tax=Tanacetum cinerariifolium TaxID=118510 RepID=A0A6L2LMZ0_TANCI|nr:Gag-Pol polyprotein [Tanacetum cinerariifolium]